MKDAKKIKTPLDDKKIKGLKAGDKVLITGTVYTARDVAHKRFIEALDKGAKLPVNLKNQIIFYAGPTPAKPGMVIGSCGPTTSYRMDDYTPKLLEVGLKGMIGKGRRSKEVVESIKKNGAVYFVAVGGAAVFLSRAVKKSEVVAYSDLGAGAVRELEVEDFPVIVGVDSSGNDIYEGRY